MSAASASSSTTLTPTIHWSQSHIEILIRIDVRDALKEKIKIKVSDQGNRLEVQAESRNQPNTHYTLSLPLYDRVFPTLLHARDIHPTHFDITLAKILPDDTKSWWPRLTDDGFSTDKNKIKVDWDRWKEEDEAVGAEKKNDNTSSLSDSEREKLQLQAEYKQLTDNQRILSQGKLPPSIQKRLDELNSGGGGGLQITDTNPALLNIPAAKRLRISYLLAYNLFLLIGIGMILFLFIQNVMIHSGSYPTKEMVAQKEAMLMKQRDANNNNNNENPFDDTATPTGNIHLPLVDTSSYLSTLTHTGGFTNGIYYGLTTFHHRIASLVYIIQFLCSLEFIHIITGLLQGNTVSSFILHGGRNIILYGIIYGLMNQSTDYSIGLLYIVWASGDFIRYLYYLIQYIQSSDTDIEVIAETWFSSALVVILKNVSVKQWMMKLRYMIPLLLLPFGFYAELRVIYCALDDAAQISLGFITLREFLIVLSIPGYLMAAPYLYLGSIKQMRSKLFGGGSGKKKAGSSKSVISEAKESKKVK